MDKIALVTGANRGIGLEICRQLGGKGMTVVMTSRNREKGESAAKQLCDEGLTLCFRVLDVTNDESIEQVKDFIKQKFQRLDVLINNAGISIGGGGAADADLEAVKQTMETNFYGPWRLFMALLPLLRKSSEGRIINVSSRMGALGGLTGGYAAYRLSKTALNALTILMAGELEKENVKINAMCPGWVRTAMGGKDAPRSVTDGAETAVWLATLPDGGPSGKFFAEKQEIPW